MVTNYTVIAYREVHENVNGVDSIRRIYDDTTEKNFKNQNDAEQYRRYLDRKIPFNSNTATDLYINDIYQLNELDITALKRADALSKLTPDEITLLGITP
jgi:hypothetical protein